MPFRWLPASGFRFNEAPLRQGVAIRRDGADGPAGNVSMKRHSDKEWR